MFNDLCTLSSIPEDTIKTYLAIMLNKDESSNNVAVLTATKADAMRQLNELSESFLSGKVNVNKTTLSAPNGTTIYFIPVQTALQEMRGRRFKAIHFRR